MVISESTLKETLAHHARQCPVGVASTGNLLVLGRRRLRRQRIVASTGVVAVGIAGAIVAVTVHPQSAVHQAQEKSTGVHAMAWRGLPSLPADAQQGHLFDTGQGLLYIAGADNRQANMVAFVLAPGGRTWRQLRQAPLRWRTGETTIWTGAQAITWGGTNDSGELADGATLTPTEGWSSLPAAPLRARYSHQAVWAGTQMLVWGGAGGGQVFNDGASYDPATRLWSKLPTAPLTPRSHFVAVWTGTEMLVWGGCGDATVSCDDVTTGAERADGAAYSPTTRTWRTLARAPLAAQDGRQAVWADGKMIVWGGRSGQSRADGASYDPRTDTWTRLSAGPLSSRVNFSMAWSGARIVIWGGVDSGGRQLSDGATLDPATWTWAKLPQSPLSPRSYAAVVADPPGAIIFGGCCEQTKAYLDGARVRIP